MYFLFKGRLVYITGGLTSGGEGAYNWLLGLVTVCGEFFILGP